jgi:hypothetical protein
MSDNGSTRLPWTAEEIEDMLADAISDSMEMDWTSRDGAKAIMREMADCGLHITRADERSDVLASLKETMEALAMCEPRTAHGAGCQRAATLKARAVIAKYSQS